MRQYAISFIAAISLLLFIGVPNAEAVPAFPRRISVTQSDGTRLSIRMVGDEYQHHALSEDGYTLIGGPDNDYYYAMLSDDGQLLPTTVKAKPTSRLSPDERVKVAALPKGIVPIKQTLQRTPYKGDISKRMLMSSVNGITPPQRMNNSTTTGKFRSLVLLVQFSDIKFTTPSPQQAFTALLNQDGYNLNGATGSAWNYYYDNSNGLFDPEFIVAGPYTASKTAAYYAGRNGTTNPYELIAELCEKADGDVDFSQYADERGIRDIFVFFAGHNQAEGAPNTIWPHRSDVDGTDYVRILDGATLSGYACSSEYKGASGRRMCGIGTFCHEFGHVLGWPDFYDTDYNGSGGNTPAIESFSLMCMGSYNNDSRTPPSLNILERWMLGWATPDEFDESGIYDLEPVHKNKGYLIRAKNTTSEYFLAEYRGSGTSVWDNPKHIEGSGMLVYHVDFSSSYQRLWTTTNRLNASPSHECMKLVRSVPNTAYDPNRTFFPGTANVMTLTPTNNEHYNAWNRATPAIHFSSIIEKNGMMTLNVIRIGGPDLNFTADTYQHDALLSWADSSSKNWNVSWKQANSTTELGSETLQTPRLHLTDLSPATTYEITIASKTAADEVWEQAFIFTTAIRGSGHPRIGLLGSEYDAKTPILLTLMDYKGAFKELQWLVDGKTSTSNYITLAAGEHRITAVIVGSDNSKEYIIKYITVK